MTPHTWSDTRNETDRLRAVVREYRRLLRAYRSGDADVAARAVAGLERHGERVGVSK